MVTHLHKTIVTATVANGNESKCTDLFSECRRSSCFGGRHLLTLHCLLTPDLVDIEQPLSDEELYVLAQQYANEGDFVSVQTRFNYAWGLIKSRKLEDQQLGVQILAQVYRDTPSRRRECLYYLAIGSYKLGEFTDARKYCDLLLQIEPDDPQSAKLRQIIEDKLAKEGIIGIAIVGGVIAVGAAILGAVLSQKKR